MLDGSKFTFAHPEALHRLSHSLAFEGATGEVNTYGFITSPERRGMRAWVRPSDGLVTVQGSLHTFTKGHNLGLFTANEVPGTVDDLAAWLNLPPEWLIVKKIEVGVNIPLQHSPQSFLHSLVSHVGKRFFATEPDAKQRDAHLFKVRHTEYEVKGYNKSDYSRSRGNGPLPIAAPHLLRWETALRKPPYISRITGLPAATLADLARRPVLLALADNLRYHWHKTQRRRQLDYTGLGLAESALLHTAQDGPFWQQMKALQPPSTYERNRSRALSSLKKQTIADEYDARFARALLEAIGD